MKNDLSKYNVQILPRRAVPPSSDVFTVEALDERDARKRPIVKRLTPVDTAVTESGKKARIINGAGTATMRLLGSGEANVLVERATVLDRVGTTVTVRAPTHGVLNRAKAVIEEHREVIANLAKR